MDFPTDEEGRPVRALTILALAVLRSLDERDQHPYEVRQRMKGEGLDRIVKVTHGALYHAFEGLAKSGLIRPVETVRDSGRPERTVYAITEDGRRVARERLRELLGEPVPEHSVYCAALAFLSLLPPEEVVGRLERRVVLLESELAGVEAGYAALVEQGVAGVGVVEVRHVRAHVRADLELTRELVEDIRAGRVTWTADAEG
ncbi:PadR family transcriptional regulator [Actinosynnema mirum]|uniref:Transcriptional regulator, PadR-like family n=1 Tax=Actinosynnema mirum (strain ATCC 29888 / DSM 43827 / JCM 3225 / NBRC 14064 / NCIMB 13271 / NRRL B-12336 / IMRU 3971 / 101) TaxID=446462 RepID=C6WM40_ACTMD|nr:PadR family transcriptional regulator [Actinosynnema mirum]ACU34774.1 transcriptional regulator, PadR-like family [Actinosynnema mirum DSM 43827]